jgi:hypothetical protein
MCKCCGDGASPLGEVEDVMSQQSGKSPHRGACGVAFRRWQKQTKGKKNRQHQGKNDKKQSSWIPIAA